MIKKVEANFNNTCFCANKIPRKEALFLNSRLLNSESVDIFCHTSTDEDSFNSAKIMDEYLKENGVKTRIITSGGKKNYGYNTKKYNIIQSDNFPKKIDKAQTALCLDFSSIERVPSGAFDYLGSFDKKDIVCIDHHHPKKPFIDEYVLLEKQYKGTPKINKVKNAYIDSSAKSATSVLTRFFEALGVNMSKKQIKSAFCGTVDDMNKSGYLRLDGNGGIKKTEKFENDKNAKEVFEFLENSLTNQEKTKIINHVDILTNLNKEEQAFRKGLYDKIQLTKNGKMAYIVIEADNKEWEALGGDNKTTSNILRDFRTRILEHKAPDDFISEQDVEKFKDVDITAAFYPDYQAGKYKISVHSNKDYVEKLYAYNREHYNKNLTAGGHPNRGGGNMKGFDKKENAAWVSDFIKSAERMSYSD